MLQCETCNWYWWCYCVCVRLPRPGSRASSRASSRADWCVTPNAYHREEMDDPNSNRKVTRVCYVTWVTLNAVLVVQSVTVIVACWCVSVCVCVLSTLFVLLIILSLILMQSDFKLLTFCHCWPCFVTKQLFCSLQLVQNSGPQFESRAHFRAYERNGEQWLCEVVCVWNMISDEGDGTMLYRAENDEMFVV